MSQYGNPKNKWEALLSNYLSRAGFYPEGTERKRARNHIQLTWRVILNLMPRRLAELDRSNALRKIYEDIFTDIGRAHARGDSEGFIDQVENLAGKLW